METVQVPVVRSKYQDLTMRFAKLAKRKVFKRFKLDCYELDTLTMVQSFNVLRKITCE